MANAKKLALLETLAQRGATFGERQASMCAIARITGEAVVEFTYNKGINRRGRACEGFTIYINGWNIYSSNIESDVVEFKKIIGEPNADKLEGVVLARYLEELNIEYEHEASVKFAKEKEVMYA